MLGYERGAGFEQVPNFKMLVDGYVGDGNSSVVGYTIQVILGIKDPLSDDPASDNTSRYVCTL